MSLEDPGLSTSQTRRLLSRRLLRQCRSKSENMKRKDKTLSTSFYLKHVGGFLQLCHGIMKSKQFIYLIFLLFQFCAILFGVDGANVNDVIAERQRILADEDRRFLGGSLTLNPTEQAANAILMQAKSSEYDLSFTTANFTPANHYFLSKPAMLQSKVYQIISQMPKGAALHVHDMTMTPLDFIVNDASYRPNLYVCSPPDADRIDFKFASSPPAILPNCTWDLVSTRRAQEGAAQFDAWLRSKLSLYTPTPQETYPASNDIWTASGNKFHNTKGIVSYAPIATDYFYQGLLSFHNDNVQYLELRTDIPDIYLLNGTFLTPTQVIALYQDTFNWFRQDYPSFSGAKVIYTAYRRVSNVTMANHIALTSQLKNEFPNTVAGFDISGHEDEGPPMKSFLNVLVDGMNADPTLKFFFHAGETDWEGTDVDENLIDAIVLNTTRIGHAFAITKHPAVLEMVTSKRVPIEVNPISNQVLGLVADLRNHPVTSLFTTNFPVVISSDDPAMWEAFGLSPDFYMAFMGLAGKKADLRTLKQLALNSITYSAMNSTEKNAALAEWQRRWDVFVQNVK